MKKQNKVDEFNGFDETKIIKMARLRFDQSQFPSKDPSLNYKLGYLQGFQDALKVG